MIYCVSISVNTKAEMAVGQTDFLMKPWHLLGRKCWKVLNKMQPNVSSVFSDSLLQTAKNTT